MNGLVYYKLNDLRINNHLPLYNAHLECKNVNHVFTYDPRWFDKTNRGIDKISKKRFQFLYDSINDLKNSLYNNGNKLYIYYGKPEDILLHLIDKCSINKIYTYNEYIQYEKNILNKCKHNVFHHHSNNIEFKLYEGSGGTLLSIDNIPFNIDDLGYFTTFRNIIEKNDILEDNVKCINKPDIFQNYITINDYDNNDNDDIIQTWIKITNENINDINIDDFNYQILPNNKNNENDNDNIKSFNLKGGETFGLERINYYITNGHISGRLCDYKQLRNGLTGLDYSSKLSPFLAHGCISSGQVYEAVKNFEKDSGIENESTYWLIFELLWRDYMHFYALKAKNKLFHLNGIHSNNDNDDDNYNNDYNKKEWNIDPRLISLWMEGKTGYPFIDAFMRELNSTGYMSNRGRQIVASFFTRDLKQDWRYGAEYFECMLLDYDVCSNWGNWQYASGVGPDPREDRYFNIIKQGTIYDPDCEFIRLWVPELSLLSDDILHNILLLTQDVRNQYNITEIMYPKPICNLLHSSFVPESKKKLKQRLKSGGIPKSKKIPKDRP